LNPIRFWELFKAENCVGLAMKLLRAMLLFSVLGAGVARADPEQAANRLLVETAVIWNQYQALPADDPAQFAARLDLLQQAEANLSRIVADYPESSLAVQLATTGAVGMIATGQIEAASAEVTREIECLKDLKHRMILQIIAEALQTARGIEDARARVMALAAVAGAQAASGDVAGALQTIAEAREAALGIEDAFLRARALADVAQAQTAAGDVAGAVQTFASARETARGIEDADQRAQALAVVAEAQAAAGDVAGALQTARGIEEAYLRAWALAAVARAQAAAGDVPGALQTIDEALQTARGIESASTRAFALAAVARAQAAAGDVAGALQTARGIEEASVRARALAHTATTLAAASE